MTAAKKRVLWLINHTTLRSFEIPLLIELGYEVYTPKVFPCDESYTSASVDYSYDATLSISKEEIDLLNKVDFYEYISPEAIEIINKHFCICHVFPSFRMLKEVVRKFLGVILFRPFGLEAPMNYTKLCTILYGFSLFEEIRNLNDRFYFGQLYDNLKEVEADLFKQRALTFPVGLKNATVQDKWKGDKARILFICPRIETSSYYKEEYKTFVADFGSHDYVIGGAQPIKCMDEKVVGFLSNEEYEDMYCRSRVMFYHSQEKYHLHYHPFEAIKCGLPLLFMGGGMLDALGGRNLPGRCANIRDAKKKIKRILAGDKAFIDQIRQTQHVLLRHVSYEHCKTIWETNIKTIEASIEKIAPPKKKKVGIILGCAYLGGVLDFSIRFVEALHKGITENGDQVELVFGYSDSPFYKEKKYFQRLENIGIQVRPFDWKAWSNEEIKEIIALKYGADFDRSTIVEPKYYTPDDKMNQFNDCDYIIFTVDRVPGPLFIFQPYAVAVHDFIQRYIPDMFAKHYEKPIMNLLRSADVIITNKPPTRKDLVQYVGIPLSKMREIPPLFDAITDSDVFEGEMNALEQGKYFLWSTNTAPHKNHKVVLQGLSDYYRSGGKLKCMVTGVETEMFNIQKEPSHPSPYVEEIRSVIKKDEYIKRNLCVQGELPKGQYLKLLKNAQFLLHGGLIDNGNMSVVDAALLGVPAITSRYPATEYYEDVMHLHPRYFDPYEPQELTALLIQTETDAEAFKKNLPCWEDVSKFTQTHQYTEVYKQVKAIVQF